MSTTATSTEALRTLAQRFADEIINGRDLDGALTDLVAGDFNRRPRSPRKRGRLDQLERRRAGK